MHRRVALLPLRGDHRHAALEAQQRHNVLLMLRALLAAYAVPPNCELLAALRLGAAGRPDVYVRPRFDHDHTDHSGRFLVVTIGLTAILTCNKHPIYAAVPYTKHQSEAVLLAPSTLPTGDAMDYVSDNFGAAAATAPLHNFRVWRGAHGWAHAACCHVS